MARFLALVLLLAAAGCGAPSGPPLRTDDQAGAVGPRRGAPPPTTQEPAHAPPPYFDVHL